MIIKLCNETNKAFREFISTKVLSLIQNNEDIANDYMNCLELTTQLKTWFEKLFFLIDDNEINPIIKIKKHFKEIIFEKKEVKEGLIKYLIKDIKSINSKENIKTNSEKIKNENREENIEEINISEKTINKEIENFSKNKLKKIQKIQNLNEISEIIFSVKKNLKNSQ
jgi:hypothetical protein